MSVLSKFFRDLSEAQRNRKAGLLVSPVDISTSKISELLEKFTTKEFQLHGKTHKALANVNADPGVTEQILSILASHNPKTESLVLNVGCGRKEQMDFISTLGFEGYGIDFDIDDRVASDRLKFHDLNSQEAIPFPEEKFDIVICQEIIEHLENPWLLFRKVKRVLKVNGTMIISTPNLCYSGAKNIFFNSAVGYSYYFNDADLWQHINPIPYWEMLHLINYNGFHLEQVTGNHEFYYQTKHKDNNPELLRNLIIEQNPVLIFELKKITSEIKIYSPIPTYKG